MKKRTVILVAVCFLAAFAALAAALRVYIAPIHGDTDETALAGNAGAADGPASAQDTAPEEVTAPVEGNAGDDMPEPSADREPENSLAPETAALMNSNGSIGTLSIPAIGVNVQVFEGVDAGALDRGAGHFGNTSVWTGNVCAAGHNRGTNCYFGDLHKLREGDRIIYATRLGTRTYAVTGVTRVLYTDLSGLAATEENTITLYTCVRGESDYRWCVKGAEVV